MTDNTKTKREEYDEADTEKKEYKDLKDNIKTKLETCVENSSTLKEGYFIHADGEPNNHWIDLSGLHRQFLLNKEVVKKALRMKLIKIIKENSINTIVFTTQYISGTSDFRLSCIDVIVDEVLQELNQKTEIEYSYLKRMTPEKLVLSPEPKKKEFNLLLIVALSLHDNLIQKTLNLDIVNSRAQSKSVLSIIKMETHTNANTIYGPSNEDYHTSLILFKSYFQRPHKPEDHSVDIEIDYRFSDYQKDLKYLFSLEPYYKQYLKDGNVNDELKKEFVNNKQYLSNKAKVSKIDEKHWIADSKMRYRIEEDIGKKLNIYGLNIDYKLKDFLDDVPGRYYILGFVLFFICVFLYNPPNINWFFEFLKQNIGLLLAIVGITPIIVGIIKYIFKKTGRH